MRNITNMLRKVVLSLCQAPGQGSPATAVGDFSYPNSVNPQKSLKPIGSSIYGGGYLPDSRSSTPQPTGFEEPLKARMYVRQQACVMTGVVVVQLELR